jgi:peptidoglycan DL-endopeptidase LytE
VTSRARFVIALVLSALAFQVPAVAMGADSGSYVVRDGDTLIGIAGRMGVGLSDLLLANHLEVTDLILPGQRLTVPGGTVSGGGSSSYTVRAGDALYTIARRNGVSLGALLAANNLSIHSVIVPGQRLTIPAGGGGGGGSPAPSAGSYTVQAGDYLSAIASRNGVSLSTLLRANNLTVDSLILPGQRLTIPGGRGGGTPTPAPRGGGGNYTVRAGDSLSVIASRHDVSLTALLRVNNLTVNSLIVPGQRLSLPAGATVGPIDRVLAYALAQVGKPYRFFTKGPDSFDCSGLTLAAYAQIGIRLVHYSGTQARQGVPVDFLHKAIRPGDLVFMATNGSSRINHVGIALNGSMWVQARSTALGVRVTPLPPDSLILAVRRFVPSG